MQKRPWHRSQRGARCVRAAPSTCKDQRGQPGISHRLRMVSDGVEMRVGCAHACCSGCACLSQNCALHSGHAMGRKESVPHVGRAQCSPSRRDMRQRVEMSENGPFHHDALDGGGGDGRARHQGRVCPILPAPIPSGWVWQFL